MAISFVGGIAGAAIDGGNVTLTLPSMLSSDLVVVAGGHLTRAGKTPTIGSGDYTSGSYTGASAGQILGAVGYKFMGATPDTTVVCTNTANANDTAAYVAMVFRGVDSTTPFDVAFVGTTINPTSTNPVPPAITTVTDNAVIVVFANSSVNDGAITAPSGYGDLTNTTGSDVNSQSAGAAWKTLAAHGTETPASFTDWSSGGWAACTVALRPAVATVLGQFHYRNLVARAA